MIRRCTLACALGLGLAALAGCDLSGAATAENLQVFTADLFRSLLAAYLT